MSTVAIDRRFMELWERPKTLRGWFATVDHKYVGMPRPSYPYTGIQFSPSYGLDFYGLSLIFLTISTTAGAVNFIVTILRLRAPGMTTSRMRLFLYSTLTISFAILLALPALTVACVFMELDRRWETQFFQIANSGTNGHLPSGETARPDDSTHH